MHNGNLPNEIYEIILKYLGIMTAGICTEVQSLWMNFGNKSKCKAMNVEICHNKNNIIVLSQISSHVEREYEKKRLLILFIIDVFRINAA